jgi:hypothetical protein
MTTKTIETVFVSRYNSSGGYEESERVVITDYDESTDVVTFVARDGEMITGVVTARETYREGENRYDPRNWESFTIL